MRDYLDKAELLLLPLIAKDTSDCKKWLCPGLIGVYYKDTNKPHWEDKIIVVYNGREMNQPILNWNLSDYKYEKYEEYINNKAYYIYAYTVPPQFKKDFNLIINGDYSKISIQAKNRILEFHFKKHNGKCLATYKKDIKSAYY